jgi:hypothetical protein
MYVKWKEYRSYKRGVVLRAELVESFRDEVTSRPRSRYLGYLGSIQKSYASDWLARLCFWECAETRMAMLPLSAEQKERAREKLHERIHCPKEWRAAFTAKFGCALKNQDIDNQQ